ncbi:MAG: ATP-binding protein, partial [Bacteroidaceae bacterium]|nr:ATP-binding protein [Bacteroidaceae bacterium]
MKKDELKNKIRCGETSRVQFKQQFTTQKEIAAEMVAFANCEGGELLFGVKDKTG